LSAARKVGVLVLGWTLVLAGVAALVLPGPGLLLLLAGMTILSQEYEWARRRVEPVKVRALQTAEESVQSATRTALSVLSALVIVGVGVVWTLNPRIPETGPFGPMLPLGGWPTGVSLILSGLVALGLVIESIRRFRLAPRTTSSPR